MPFRPCDHSSSGQDSFCRLTALGMINCLGSDHDEIRAALEGGDVGKLSLDEELIPGRTVYVGRVDTPMPPCPRGFESIWSRNTALSLAAFTEIEEEVAKAVESFGRQRVGVVLGSSTSGISEAEFATLQLHTTGMLPGHYCYRQQEMGSVSTFLSLYAGLKGPSYTISTACSSSAKVFQSGSELIRSGLCDAVIVGGVDSLCRFTLNGFASLDLLSRSRARPFSAMRDGINIGEGAALFLMTREAGGIQLLAVGESSDAYHISTPDPEARGAISALREVLSRGGLQADDIAYVNLHGTGTSHNDAVEARAIHGVFGTDVPCSSTKPLVGHMLGASGATEAGFCWLMLEKFLFSGELRLPPHVNGGEMDPVLDRINLAGRSAVLTGIDKPVCLSNSFGFGGSNCAVALQACAD